MFLSHLSIISQPTLCSEVFFESDALDFCWLLRFFALARDAQRWNLWMPKQVVADGASLLLQSYLYSLDTSGFFSFLHRFVSESLLLGFQVTPLPRWIRFSTHAMPSSIRAGHSISVRRFFRSHAVPKVTVCPDTRCFLCAAHTVSTRLSYCISCDLKSSPNLQGPHRRHFPPRLPPPVLRRVASSTFWSHSHSDLLFCC